VDYGNKRTSSDVRSAAVVGLAGALGDLGHNSPLDIIPSEKILLDIIFSKIYQFAVRQNTSTF